MDILDEMTQEEIVSWVRQQPFFMVTPPRKSSLLFHRWQVMSAKVQENMDAHCAAGKEIDMAKRDEYAKRFNASTDIKEKIALAEKMEPYDDQWNKWIVDGKKSRDEADKTDKLYDQIDIARKEEAQRAGKRG